MVGIVFGEVNRASAQEMGRIFGFQLDGLRIISQGLVELVQRQMGPTTIGKCAGVERIQTNGFIEVDKGLGKLA
jgi:hypothetical protein